MKKDADFHQVLFNATRNDRLTQIISNLKEQIDRFRLKSFSNPSRMKSILKEHKNILDAIKDRDTDRAEKLAKQHIENVETNVMNILRGKNNLRRNYYEGPHIGGK